MRNKFLSILVCLTLVTGGVLALTGCNRSGDAAGNAAAGKTKYHCPMHPTYVSDRPGDCPICNMKLVPIKDNKPAFKPMPAAPEEKTAHIQPGQFYCPMHLNVVSNAPGTCPECEMFLVEKKAAPAPGHGGHAAAADAAAPVPGRVTVMIAPEKQQLIGLRTAPVEQRNLSRVIRTTGTFEHDERRLARIAPRFSGWIRDLKVNYTGQPVEKGEPLLTVYSPDLLSAENEYLLAFRRLQALPAGSPERESAQRLVESARRRLQLWQISEEEIRELERTGQPKDEILLRSPVSGHVVTKTAVEGRAFNAGDTLYEIADLHHLWLRATVYEYELPLIKIGQTARVILPYQGNKTFNSEVTFIYPHIDPLTRRAEIRLEMDNPGHLLRPDMWANVEIEAAHGEALAIPASAVIDTGTRFVAFVKRADDHLEPREVKIGVQTDDYYEVLAGLKPGEEVVTRALFLVDSESQLKAAIAGMSSAAPGDHAGHAQPATPAETETESGHQEEKE